MPPSPFSTGDQLLDLWQHTIDDHRNPCGSWVEPVTLIELGIGGDAGEEEWIQDGFVLGGELRINGVEGAAVFGAHVGGRHHTAQQDRNFSLLETTKHRVQGLAGDGGIETAQRIIGAKLQDDGVGAVRNRPIKPGQSACGGVSGYARVHDIDGQSLGAERALQLRRKCLIGGEAVSGGERIPERHDIDDALGGPRVCGDQRHADAEDASPYDGSEPPASLHSPGGFPI